MTSHYFYCIVANSFDATFTALNRAFGNVYSSRFGKTLQSGVILGEQWYFRVTSDVAVLILLKELSSAETEIEVVSCAGGAGYLAVSYSAHSSYVHKVRNFLIDSGFKIENEREIPYYSDYVRKSHEKTL